MADGVEGIISAAIENHPDRGAPDTDPTDTVDVDPGTETASVADDGTGEPASTDTVDEATGDTPPAPVPAPAPKKKIEKWIPGERFQAQTERARLAEEKAAALEAEKATIQAERDSFDRALKMFEDEGQIDRLADILLADPKWASRLTRVQKQELKEAVAEAKTTADAPANDAPPTMPEADIELSDGSRTWSQEAMQDYVARAAAYSAAQAKKELAAEIAALKEQVSPFVKREENEKAVNERAASYGQEFESLFPHYGKELVIEQKGPMLAWLKDQWGNPDPKTWLPTTPVKNAKATLRDAEYAVLKPAERAKYEKGRTDALSAADQAKARLISEQNTRAAAAERPATAVSAPVRETPSSTEDIIRAAIRRKGLSA